MYSYEANRLLPGSPESVRSAVDALSTSLAPWRARLLADENVRRTVAVAVDSLSDEADIWLTWEFEQRGADTNVHVVLDETEPGPDPDLEGLLDLLADHLGAAPGPSGRGMPSALREPSSDDEFGSPGRPQRFGGPAGPMSR
jgi:hypothetical protein